MPTPIRLPDGRTVTINTNDPQQAAKAARVILAREAMASRLKMSPHGGFDEATNRLVSGATLGLSDVEPAAIAAATTGVKNIGLRLAGKQPTFGAGDAYTAQRLATKADTDAFAKAHPMGSMGLGFLGGLAMPGSEQIANFVEKGAAGLASKAPGFLQGLVRPVLTSAAAPAKVVRGMIAAAPIGAVTGAAEAAPGEELQGAGQGAALAAGTAGILPPALSGGARLARAGGRAVGGTVGSVVRGGLNLAGLQRGDPTAVATRELAKALRADGATPQQMIAALDQWNKTGASAPAILDIARQLPSGGGNTLRLVTGAAMGGKGAGAAQQYATDIATALPERATSLVRGFTPETQTAPAMAASLEGRQSSLAEKMYPDAYATPLGGLTPEATSALEGEHGIGAIRQAITAAKARRDQASVDHLTALLKPAEEITTGRIGGDEFPLPQHILDQIKAEMPTAAKSAGLTAGDLDRVRIAMGKRGAAEVAANRSDVGSGLFERAKDLNTVLDAVPELGPARGTYKGIQAQRDALELGGAGLTTPSDEYAPQLTDLTGKATTGDNPYPISAENIRGAAGVGYQQAARNAIEAPAAGATGVLNKLARSPRQIANQNVTYDPEIAAKVRAGIENELSRVESARAIDPNLNSRTAGRLDALSAITKPKSTAIGMALDLVNKLREGVALTDDERQAIVHAGIGLADPNSGVITHLHPAVQPMLDRLDALATLASPQAAAATEERYQSQD